MTVEEAKEKWLNGYLTIDDASEVDPDSHGYDATFICEDGFFTVSGRIVNTNIEE